VLAQGKMPYAGRSPLAAYQNIMTTAPVPLCEVNKEVPQIFSDLVMSMVDKDINLRPASWEKVMSRIEEIANTL
jgi:hypothetical protein